MKTLLEKFRPLFAPDGGGGGGAEPAGGEGAAAPAGDGGNGTAADGAGKAAGAAGDNGEASPAAQPYRPEGLPDAMFGKDDRETMDNMAKSLKDYRDRDAGVPETPEAYRQFDLEAVPEAIRSHLEGLASDPLFDTVSKVAMEEKIPVATMQKLTAALYGQAAEAGLLEPMVDVAAERAALVPDTARSLSKADQDKAIDARLQANEDFVKLWMKPGADGKSPLDPKVGEHALLMLMDTAAGNQFLEFMRSRFTGEDRAQPFNGNGHAPGGQNKREALRARLAAPEMQPGHRNFSRDAYDALMEEYKNL